MLNNRAVIYARKSSESSERQIQSLPDQLKILQEYAAKEKIKIIETFQESKSAMTPNHRIKFLEMIDLIRDGKADTILCWDISRLSRNLLDTGLIDELFTKGILKEIMTPRLSYTKDTFVQFGVESVLNTEYSRALSKNVRRSIQSRIERGIAPHMPLPGFKFVGEKGRKTHEPDSRYFSLMRQVFDRFLTENYSVIQITDYAKEIGLKHWRGDYISKSRMHELLRSPYYTGRFTYKGEEHQGIHQAMILEEEYQEIQRILKNGAHPKKVKHIFPLNGLIKCGECLRQIYGESHTKNYKNGNSQTFNYYRCSKRGQNKKAVDNCSQPYIRDSELEGQVSHYLETIKPGEKYLKEAIEFLKKAEAPHEDIKEASRKSLQSSLNSVEKQLKNAEVMILEGNEEFFTMDQLKDAVRKLRIERQRLQDELAKLTKKHDIFIDMTISALEFSYRAKEMFEKGTLLQKKTVMGLIGTNLYLKDKKLYIQPRGIFKIIKGSIDGVHPLKDMYEPKGNVVFSAIPEDSSTFNSHLRG